MQGSATHRDDFRYTVLVHGAADTGNWPSASGWLAVRVSILAE